MFASAALVLTIDRLGAGFLGPYGNTWLETPAFNRLSSESLLCEMALSDSPRLSDVFRSYWSPPATIDGARSNVQPTLMQKAQAAGASTILVTDEPALIDHPLAAGFAERIAIPSVDAEQAADQIEETQLAKVMQAAVDLLPSLPTSFFLWIHCRGMGGNWDAPVELRNQFAAEDDPLPGDFVEPPERRLASDADPDELLKIVHAYAGQVALADFCLEALLMAFDEHALAERTLLVVTSPRGYPLGEHGRIGPCDDALYGELLHVPLLVRSPGGAGALVRTQSLVQPVDIYDLLGDACGWSGKQRLGTLAAILRNEPHANRDFAVALAGQQRAIRTPAWFLREVLADGRWSRELFAKPDDRWEVNEIASRAGEVPEMLSAAIDRIIAAQRAGSQTDVLPLDEALRDVWR